MDRLTLYFSIRSVHRLIAQVLTVPVIPASQFLGVIMLLIHGVEKLSHVIRSVAVLLKPYRKVTLMPSFIDKLLVTTCCKSVKATAGVKIIPKSPPTSVTFVLCAAFPVQRLTRAGQH